MCLARNNQDIFAYVLNLVETDPDFYLRRRIVQHLCRHPPFRQNETCPLNTPMNVHRLWTLMS